ncbi:DMT family transporter [Halorientalis pallida]|uniref:EamA family transporter n=1 Tax=Halorientalis pallida TaxID=2479928 RepID=A0A498KQM1_9EURY|nr:DMT family transporter [Halorientalis pallida]RXK46418.1 EamA family transporter [Halorientalis pallida]
MTGTPLVVYALALLPAVLWGLGPIFDKRGMDAGGTATQAAIVVVVVDSVLYWLALSITAWPDPFAGLTVDLVAVFAVAGLFGTAMGRILVFAGVHRVGASINSAGISTRPLFASLLALGFLGEPLGPLTGVGIVVLVAGLVVLTYSKGGDVMGWKPRDLLFPVGAAAVFAAGNVLRRFGFGDTAATPLQAVAINETAALVALAAYALVTWGTDPLDTPRASYTYFTGSGLITAVALLSFFTALSMEAGRIAIVDSLAATAPLFTTVFAAVLLRDVERVTRGVVLGAAMVVVGAICITL